MDFFIRYWASRPGELPGLTFPEPELSPEFWAPELFSPDSFSVLPFGLPELFSPDSEDGSRKGNELPVWI